MKADRFERQVINALKGCRYLPGSFDKKFARDINPDDISPLQQYYIYKNGYKYRKQIGLLYMESMCEQYLKNNQKPLSRKESERVIKRALKSKDSDSGPSGATENNQLNLGI